ncbi:MAG: T9SS type A sorting domain-containing protein [Bacteroidetes bacterium]|nr:T9SS type A sorting domain-containing protein [Bacteroidota bacterium]
MKKQLLLLFALCAFSFGLRAQCNASFTYTVTNADVSVNALGTPTGSFVAYAWQWGDGGFSQGQTTAHTYTASGTYSVCLTYVAVTFPPCTTTVCQNINVVVAAVHEYENSIRNINISPNPANAFVNFTYTLPVASSVSVDLIDVTGKLAGTLESQEHEAGEHTIHYNTESLPKGVYFVRFKSRHATEFRKLILQ